MAWLIGNDHGKVEAGEVESGDADGAVQASVAGTWKEEAIAEAGKEEIMVAPVGM